MKTKGILAAILTAVLCISGTVFAELYGGGSGTNEDPYQIWTPAQMNAIGANPDDWDKQFKLMTNIDLSGYTGTAYNIIGNETTSFIGTFDGNKHIISGLTITAPTQHHVGLFGYIGSVDKDGQIRNLGVENVNITGIADESCTGGLVGCSYRGSLINCYVTGSVSGNSAVGGLVGIASMTTLSNCYANGSVSGINNAIGGLAGYTVCSSLTSCYATGLVSEKNTSLFIGGLVGKNDSSILTSCYATGSVSGGESVGGLVGYHRNDPYYGTAMLIDCYATGFVNGTDSVGGLVGKNESSITSCYATGSVTGAGPQSIHVGGLVGDNYSTLTSCYAIGSVSGNIYVGGLTGKNTYGTLTFCYATGSVTGTSYIGGLAGKNSAPLIACYAAGSVTGIGPNVGGLVGMNDLGTYTTCFWDIQTSGQTYSEGGTGLTTVAMQNLETYLRVFWDFKGEITNGTLDVWAMPIGGGYPILAWQLGNSTVSNDEMNHAIAVTVAATVSGTSIGATGLDLTRNSYNDCADVWYYFDCASQDKYTLTVQPVGFNSTLGVFDTAQHEVAFNDDFFGDKSVVILNAAAGRRYYIRVAGYDSQMGNFTLTLAQGAIQAIQGDLNYDGIVNIVDFSIMADNWLEGI